MVVNRTGIGLIIVASMIFCGWQLVIQLIHTDSHSVSQSTTTSRSYKRADPIAIATETGVITEPQIAAALPLQPAIIVKERIPLNFGGLVGGKNEVYIELTPDGNVFTSGDITGQSIHSTIGATNAANLSSNPLYRIQPGRLSFEVSALAQEGTVSVEFMPGDLKDGINLGNLSIEAGPDTSAGLLKLPPVSTSKIVFQATQSVTQATIDLAIGGRLTLSSNVSGAVNAPLDVNISTNNPQPEWIFCSEEHGYCQVPGPAIVRYGANGKYNTKSVQDKVRCNNDEFGDPIRGTLKTCVYQLNDHSYPTVVTVYEHVNFGGRAWSLNDLRKYAYYELKRNIGNNVISSIRVPTGYKLKACEYKFKGRCDIFTKNQSDLGHIGFNDKISSLEIIQSH